MKKALKWGAIIGGGLLLVIVVALLLIPMFVNVSKYRSLIEKRVSDAAGRPVSVGDDLRLSLFPWAGLTFSDLRIGNPPGFAEKDFLTVKTLDVRVRLLPLLSKDIRVQRFILNKPEIVLIKNKGGRGNWEMPQKSAGTAPTDTPAAKSAGFELPINALSVGDFAINNGTALWVDQTTGQHKKVTDISLKLKDVTLDQPIKIAFSGSLDGQPISLDGKIGPVGKQTGQGSIPLNISLAVFNELKMKLKGQVDNPIVAPRVDLAIDVTEFSPRKLVANSGRTFPVATADPKALNRLALTARIKADRSNLAVSDAKLKLDDSTLNFMLRAADFSKPDIAFDLSIDQINIDHYLPPKSEKKAGGEKPASGKSTMDYGSLRRLVIDGQLKADKLTANNLNFQSLLLKINGKNGALFLDPFKINLYQGSISGNGNLTVQENVPKTAMNLTIRNVKMGPLLKDAVQKDFLEGVANAQLNLSVAGDTPEKIKQTLNGQGEYRLNDGAIKGFDLAAMARNAEAAFGLAAKAGERPRTDFTELKIPFTIANGIAVTARSSMQSPFIRLEASGKADLVKETLDFRVDPKAVATIKGQGDKTARSGIMVPVIVSGTFASPKFRPDLKSMITQQIDKGVLESEPAKKLFENKKMKKFEEPAKGLLKDLLKKP